MKIQLDIKEICKQVGLHVPDPDYIYMKMMTAPDIETRRAWRELFNYYKGVKEDG